MYKNRSGKYVVQNTDKIKRPADNFMGSTAALSDDLIVLDYKSTLELKAMQYCDANPAISAWCLEPLAIPYISHDNKHHRYYPDFYIQFRNGQQFLVEIKHSSEVSMPKKTGKHYQERMLTYVTNKLKWNAAQHFCQLNNIQFVILTERDLN